MLFTQWLNMRNISTDMPRQCDSKHQFHKQIQMVFVVVVNNSTLEYCLCWAETDFLTLIFRISPLERAGIREIHAFAHHFNSESIAFMCSEFHKDGSNALFVKWRYFYAKCIHRYRMSDLRTRCSRDDSFPVDLFRQIYFKYFYIEHVKMCISVRHINTVRTIIHYNMYRIHGNSLSLFTTCLYVRRTVNHEIVFKLLTISPLLLWCFFS